MNKQKELEEIYRLYLSNNLTFEYYLKGNIYNLDSNFESVVDAFIDVNDKLKDFLLDNGFSVFESSSQSLTISTKERIHLQHKTGFKKED